MIINVLGCSGSIAAGCKTTAFLLDGDVLIDAGTGVGDLELDALARIDHIIVSHSHLDHVLSIGLLADAVMRVRSATGGAPIQVHALPETIAALRAHIFNGVIWPDFTRLPSAERPMLAIVPFAVGDLLELNGKRIEVLSASHTVPAVGFAVAAGRAAHAHHGVGEQADRKHVVEVRVADENVVDARERIEFEVADAGTGVDQHVTVEQERRGLAARGDGPGTSEHVEDHPRFGS